MNANLLHELHHPHNDFPSYLTELAARAAAEIERLNGLISGRTPDAEPPPYSVSGDIAPHA